jgi:hypothetical protein
MLSLVSTKWASFSWCVLLLAGAISSGSAADTRLAAGLIGTNGRQASALRVAGAQLPVRNDVQKNLEAITRAIEFAAREKADVLVTPEGSLSGYTPKFNAAATAHAMEALVQRARQANVALVLGTCFAAAEVNCHSGVLVPDGHWVVQADPRGEQFFAHTIVVE